MLIDIDHVSYNMKFGVLLPHCKEISYLLSVDDRGNEPIDVTPGEEWIARVETVRQVVEILGKRLNKVNGKFKTLEDFTIQKNDHIRKELEGRQRAEFKMKEAITSLECHLMEALSTIETMKVEMKALKKGMEVGRSSLFDPDREVKVEAPMPPMFKGVLLWHLENYFKCNRMKNDENKINTDVLYVTPRNANQELLFDRPLLNYYNMFYSHFGNLNCCDICKLA
uniref:Uncharacterized protein n=1 Tax=Solanum tuberosum TaxID=4113 RepID=M1D8Q3_SOLTU